MKPSPLRPIGKAVVRIPETYPHVYVAREAIAQPIIELDTEYGKPAAVIPVKKFVKRAPAPKKMLKKIGQAVTPILDLVQAQQSQGQIGEVIPLDLGNRFMSMFNLGQGVPVSQYLNTQEIPALAVSEPELATTIRALPEGLVKDDGKLQTFLADELVKTFHSLTNRDSYAFYDVLAKQNPKTGKFTVTPRAIARVLIRISNEYDDYVLKRGIYSGRTRDYAPLEQIDKDYDLIIATLKPYLPKYRKSIISYDTLRKEIQDIVRFMI